MSKQMPIVPLSEMQPGQEADLFALMTIKEELKTREGKPYYKVGFRDAAREVAFPIWADSAFAEQCRESWQPGEFYKIRAEYRETSFGPQLDIRRIRAVINADSADGFDPAMCQARSRFDSTAMFNELLALAKEKIARPELAALVCDLYEANRADLLTLPAASKNHHAYVGGYLEHVLSVTRTAIFLADKYDAYYPELQPRLDKDLVIAGAMLHDIGKLRELRLTAAEAEYTPAGQMIGHILQGRDMLREVAANRPQAGDVLLRLEHVIVSHQRLPEWGSPKPPMTPEAMLVHYADDLDAKYQMMVNIMAEDTTPGPLTSRRNYLQQAFYRGEP
jgi:3'-5' exoribonuclease